MTVISVTKILLTLEKHNCEKFSIDIEIELLEYVCKNWLIYFGNNRSTIDMRIDSEKISIRCRSSGRNPHFMGQDASSLLILFILYFIIINEKIN